MKRLLFKEISMVSFREKRARKIKFHPKMTVIKGENDTGKSALIKSIYRTLGAEPHQIHPEWENASVSSLLTFEIDDVIYSILKTGSRYCLFNNAGEKLKVFNSVTKELAPFFADFFNFKLPLNTREAQTQATPAFLFLPFYFDQDRSWQEQWKGFTRLRQFSNWKSDVIAFHCGMRPTEFYEAKSQRAIFEDEKREALLNRNVIYQTIKKLEEQFRQVRFDIDINNFKKEVEELLKQSEKLRLEEEKLKIELVNLHGLRINLQNQKNIVSRSLKEIEKDYNFAISKLAEAVECPTCGQTYENSLSERFAIAQDEYRCKDLLLEISKNISDVENKITSLDEKFSVVRNESKSIDELFEQKQGELKLRDIIESEGRKEVKGILLRELDTIDSNIGKCEVEISELEKIMKQYDNRERKKEITSVYFEAIKEFMIELSVLKLKENTFKRIDCNIKETGSDLPRALLAYYFSILNVISRYSTSTLCPIILDSPKQQDLDDKNWKKMLFFISKNQPNNSQIIISLVDDMNVSMGGDSIELDTKYSLLTSDEFEKISDEISPYIESCVQ